MNCDCSASYVHSTVISLRNRLTGGLTLILVAHCCFEFTIVHSSSPFISPSPLNLIQECCEKGQFGPQKGFSICGVFCFSEFRHPWISVNFYFEIYSYLNTCVLKFPIHLNFVWVIFKVRTLVFDMSVVIWKTAQFLILNSSPSYEPISRSTIVSLLLFSFICLSRLCVSH